MKKTATGSFFCDSCTFGTYSYAGTNSSDCERTGINVNYMDKTVKPANDFSDM
jgi:hypothetical protein